MKELSYFIVGLLIVSSFAIIGIGEEAGEHLETINMNFVEPNIVDTGTYVELKIDGTNSYIFNSGEPMLPAYTETITLPFGTTISNVQCNAQDIKSVVLSKKIMPAPQQLPKGVRVDIILSTEKNEEIYSSEDFFPNNWFSYHVGVGLDKNMDHKTFLTIKSYPVRYSPGTDTIQYAKDIDVTVTYNVPNSNPFPANTGGDLVIIAPEKFEGELEKLVTHKIGKGVTTIIKTTEDIYIEYSGDDKPEQIKYFIKDAMESWNTKYILLVGGLKSLIWGNPKEHTNYGDKSWYVPVRYSNLRVYEAGYCCDLYYADIYKEGGVFDNWDSNGNGIFAEWGKDTLDLYPDVAVGRLACRNIYEVRSVVDKIITYENGADPSWFEKIILISGDGFLDQENLNIKWDTKGLPDGEYTIYAQSTNPEMDSGPIEEMHVTLDKSVETNLNFNHDDHTRVSSYPADPMAEIVSVTDGDTLGYTDYSYTPTEREAYCNDHTGWANVRYFNEALYIRGKTYDPKPYGTVSTIDVWIKNSGGTTVFSDQKTTEMYFEGEWTTGDIPLHERAGGSYYMPPDYEREYLWTSNGLWTEQSDVIDAISDGSGFAFFSGHGSPAVWVNHKPGIPGNRKNADTDGLMVIDLSGGPPFLPMNKLSNNYKNPVVVVGGCHNSMFNVSMIPTFLDRANKQSTHSYGNPTAECWSWWLTRLSKRGAIAAIGNSGYGFGILGEWCTSGGVDNWITTEFFKQYGTEGHEILGEAYNQVITSYIDAFGKSDPVDVQTIQQWILHGDPSLQLGGYGSQQGVNINIDGYNGNNYGVPSDPVQFQADAQQEPNAYYWDLDDDGEFDDATGETIEETWSEPGIYWVSIKAVYDNEEIIHQTVIEIEKDQGPDKPTRPSGETNIKIGRRYTYTTSATDPYNNNELWYIFDWGDGNFGFSGPHKSGETASASHKWTEKGSYEIKVWALDGFGYWSEWSDPLSVSLPRTRQPTRPLLQPFENFFEKFPNAFPLIQHLLGL